MVVPCMPEVQFNRAAEKEVHDLVVPMNGQLLCTFRVLSFFPNARRGNTCFSGLVQLLAVILIVSKWGAQFLQTWKNQHVPF
jgi:hypothetical protein